MKLNSLLSQLKGFGATIEKDEIEDGLRTITLRAPAPTPPLSDRHVWHSICVRPDQECIHEFEAERALANLWYASKELVM